MVDYSKLILGTAQFGSDYGINNKEGKISENEINKILDFAYKNNIAVLDTASNYGNSEEIIGKYLENNPKKFFKIITKISEDKLSLKQQLFKSLKKLKRKKVEVLLFHTLELYNFFRKELPYFTKLYKGKKFNEIGVSLYTNDQINLIVDDINIDRVQLPFNLLDNSTIRRESIIKLRSNGKKVDARSIFLQGLFFKSQNKLPSYFNPIKKDLEFLKNLLFDSKSSMEGLALIYAFEQDFLDHIVIGVDSFEQLQQNIQSLNIPIPKEVISKINSIKIKNTDFLNPSLWPK